MFLTALRIQRWGLKLPTLRQRLFRCVSIRENDDGTYAITAVQHVPEKEAIVDNGAHFDGDQSGTVMVSRRQRAASDREVTQTAGNIRCWRDGTRRRW
ncbi:fibronectin type III domain protein [Escherichia coli 180600]|nr:fibronectin type III domain protein [Escherichia coli 180600]